MTQPTQVDPIIGRLVLTGDTASALPLKKTVIQGQITGPLISVSVSQQFTNPIENPAEMDYLFPLPENSAIVDFELRVGGRVIKAEIQEAEQARQAYQEASQKGQRAGLLEQRRPNLFAIHISNVLPGETIHTTLRYQDHLKFEDGKFEVVLPMGLTPRYHTADHPEEARATHAPVALPGEAIGAVEIQLSIDAGVAVSNPTSPTHSLVVSRIDERRFQVSLDGSAIPDHDFVLRYALADASPAACAWSSADASGDYFMAALFPPALPENFQAPRRSFVFVLDRSGSMSGEPIAQARNALRACLRSLNPDDTFQILLFDDLQEWFKLEPSPVTQEEVDQADRFLGEVQGRGGTEILQALEAVFSQNSAANQTRYIVFLTDGAVSAESRVLEKIRNRIGSGRLFTFGIGPSVNRALLNQMARLGRGTAEFLQLDEDIEGAIIRFQDRVSFPVLTDLAFSWSGVRAWDIYPARLGDLYAGQPVELCCRVQVDQADGALTVHGKRNGQDVEMRLEVKRALVKDDSIRRVWSRARIDDLFEQLAANPDRSADLRAEIISTALAAGLATPLTAFVAVDQEITVKDGSRRRIIHVAQPLPKGLDRNSFEPLPPARGIPLPSPTVSMRNQAQPIVPFLRMHSKQDLTASTGQIGYPKQSGASAPGPEFSGKAFVRDGEGGPEADGLRWLARTQQVDGNWDGDVEMTSAALLAFVRHAHTTIAGSYRQTVRKAFAWLTKNTGVGQAAFIRALALHALADATQQKEHETAAQAAMAELPQANGSVEKAVISRLHETRQVSFTPPEEIADLDTLRLVGIWGFPVSLSASLRNHPMQKLVWAWMAVIG